MTENQAVARSAESGAGDARPATVGDIRHLESSLRADMNHMENSLRADLREVGNRQWKLITIALVGLPVMLEVVPMIFDLWRG